MGASSKNEELQKLVHHLLDSQNNDKDKDLEDEKEGNQDVQDSPVENVGNHKEEQNDIKPPEISSNLSSNSSQKPLNDINNNNESKPLQNNDEENETNSNSNSNSTPKPKKKRRGSKVRRNSKISL